MSSPPKAEAAAEVIVLTPPGRGAVATILLTGPAAEASLACCFQARAGQIDWQAPPGRVRLGRWIDPTGADDTWEDVVVACPQHEQFEIHCHGGPAVVQRVVATLESLGAISRDWPTWRQAAGSMLEREALEALASARSQRTAAILLDQWRGALAQEIAQIVELVQAADMTTATQRLAALLERAPLGLHLTQPWRVVISGPPNAGKSSLVNALAGYQRAIVSPLPGTTRDVLTTPLVLDGWPLELSDTAGLRTGLDALEAAGIERARQQVARADLVIELVDGAGDSAAPLPPMSDPSTPPAPLVVVSKADLPSAVAIAPETALRVSALTAQGMEELVAAISQRLCPHAPLPGQGVPFTQRQANLVGEAHAAASAADAARALATLALLLG